VIRFFAPKILGIVTLHCSLATFPLSADDWLAIAHNLLDCRFKSFTQIIRENRISKR
jgi:hypothetical protein